MYESFFGLTREPFGVPPDPRFVYMSAKHQEALAYLMYGLQRGGGFVLLTGAIGAGKTTIWRCFLEQLPANVDVAYVVNPKLGVESLLARVCEDLRVAAPESGRPADPIDAIHGHLLLAHARGRRTLIVVDEAQALSSDVLEQLRLLTNLVTGDLKLVQMLLIGQPELNAMLDAPALEPVAQRIVARFHLPALSEADTHRYVAHRLAVAGLQGELPFDAAALARVHAICGGVPRRINVLCDRALFAAHAAGRRRVDRELVERAADEVFVRAAGATAGATPPWQRALGLATFSVLALVAVALIAQAVTPTVAPAIAAGWRAAMVAWGEAAPAAPAVYAAPAAPTTPAAAVARPARAETGDRRASAAVFAGNVTPTSPAASLADSRLATPSAGAAASASPAASAGVATPVRDASRADGLGALYAAGSADEAQAWRALARLWGVTLGAGEPCASAVASGLHCFRTRGGLAPIRQLDRPGLVALHDERGRVFHALLTGLDGERATLRAGNAEMSVPLRMLARAWRGEFATWWRAPPGYRDGMLAGPGVDSSPLDAWLAERLTAIDGGPTPLAASAGAAGSAGLGERIFAFQLAQGLAPDGLAGPVTLMRINRAGGIDEPRLQAEP